MNPLLSEQGYEALRDPVKAEWMVVVDRATRGQEFVLPIHPFKDWKRNKDLAVLIAEALSVVSQPGKETDSGNRSLVDDFLEWAKQRGV